MRSCYIKHSRASSTEQAFLLFFPGRSFLTFLSSVLPIDDTITKPKGALQKHKLFQIYSKDANRGATAFPVVFEIPHIERDAGSIKCETVDFRFLQMAERSASPTEKQGEAPRRGAAPQKP